MNLLGECDVIHLVLILGAERTMPIKEEEEEEQEEEEVRMKSESPWLHTLSAACTVHSRERTNLQYSHIELLS